MNDSNAAMTLSKLFDQYRTAVPWEEKCFCLEEIGRLSVENPAFYGLIPDAVAFLKAMRESEEAEPVLLEIALALTTIRAFV